MTSNDLIMKYYDGNANDLEKAQLRQHLKTCSKCNEEFESLKEIFNCLQEDNQIEPPKDFEEQVMKKVNMYEISRRKKVDSFLMAIYGVTLLILTVLTVTFALKVKNMMIMESVGEIGSMQDIIYLAYGILKQAAGYIKDMLSQMVYYYILVVGLITYLIMQQSTPRTEKNTKNS
jgi:predicted anti-sigma-YlaC factor YlaD